MNDSVHFAEYSVEKQYEGRYGRNRAIAITLYIVGPILLLLLMLFVMGPAAVIWFVPLCPMFLLMVVRKTYNRFFRIEYDYRIATGEFSVAEVYGKRARKEILTERIAGFEAIAPYRDAYKDACDRGSYHRVIEAVSSMSSPDVYYAVIPNEDDPKVKTLLFFEATEKMLRLLHLHNRKTVVTRVRF